MRTAGSGLVVLLCVSPVLPVPAAETALAGTWWTANRACTIMDILFQTDGRAAVLFANGDDGFGAWRLEGNVVTIHFDHLDDTFFGRFTGTQIRASHAWQESGQRQEEECTFDHVRQGPSA
jgi:hypothetical protein